MNELRPTPGKLEDEASAVILVVLLQETSAFNASFALARNLVAAGVRVIYAVSPPFEDYVAANGFRGAPCQPPNPAPCRIRTAGRKRRIGSTSPNRLGKRRTWGREERPCRSVTSAESPASTTAILTVLGMFCETLMLLGM